MKIPKAIQNLIDSFEKLPGIGPKSAQRLTFYLLHVPQTELDKFATSVQNLKRSTVLCSICFSIGESDPCEICQDGRRDKSIICVVEEPLDVLALERTGKYNGVYHVLHGRIDPLNNIGPDEIYIRQLLERVKKETKGTEETDVKEIILATNPTMEGEATAMYISKQLKSPTFAEASAGKQNSPLRHPTSQELRGTRGYAGQAKLKTELKVTRIGRGLPTGADIEYADELTIQRAMEGRSEY